MTVCIAGVCLEGSKPRIILCSDARVEYGGMGTDVGFKGGYVGLGFYMLMAGDINRALELENIYLGCLPNDLRPSFKDLIEAFRRPPEILKARLLENHARLKWGMSYEQFHQTLPNRVSEVEQIDLGCSLILAGFLAVTTYPCIFVVEATGNVVQLEHFATIGSGDWLARAALYQRRYRADLQLPEALYYIYEAKRFSEIESGVGPATYLRILEPAIFGGPEGPTLFRVVGEEQVEALEEQYKRFGLQLFQPPPKPEGCRT